MIWALLPSPSSVCCSPEYKRIYLMEIHGSLDMRGNLLKQIRLEMENGFPVDPQPGRILFREQDRTVYVCVELDGGIPLWVPMAQVKDMFRHTQSEAALEWTVPHGLNMNPALVQVFNSAGEVVIPDKIICNDPNSAIVRFLTPTTGFAIVLRGEMFGTPAQNVSYRQDFTSSTTWVVNHGLGYNPDIKVYVGNYMVQPSSIVFDNTNQATVTFATAQAGFVTCS